MPIAVPPAGVVRPPQALEQMAGAWGPGDWELLQRLQPRVTAVVAEVEVKDERFDGGWCVCGGVLAREGAWGEGRACKGSQSW